MWKWISFYSVAVLFGFLMAVFKWPSWIAVLFFVLSFILFMTEFLYTAYGTTNMKKVEKLIVKKKKEPIYAYVYAQSFGTKEDELKAIDAILKKYKQSYIQYYYRVIRSVIENDLNLALEEAHKIEKEPLASYSKTFVLAMLGNYDEALSYKIEKKWMQEAILATIALKQKDEHVAKRHIENSISAARGIQRYSLIHSFKKMPS